MQMFPLNLRSHCQNLVEKLQAILKIYNLGQKVVEQFTKFSKICSSMECFTADCSQFFSANVKICLCEGGWVLTIKSKNFGDFLKIF